MKVRYTYLLVLLAFALFSIHSSQAGKRYSVSSGDWSSTSVWSTTSGGASGASVPGASDTVYVEEGYTVTVSDTRAASVVEVNGNDGSSHTYLIIDDGAFTVHDYFEANALNFSTDVFIEVKGSGSMVVNGDMTLDVTWNDVLLDVYNNATLDVTGNLNLDAGFTKDSKLSIYDDAIVSVTGDISFSALGSNNAIVDMDNNAILNIGGDFDRSGTSNYGDFFAEVTTIVNFNGSAAQTLSVYDYAATTNWNFGEVWITNSSGVTLDTNVTINNIIDDLRVKTGGELNSGGHSLQLQDSKVFEIASGATYVSRTLDYFGGMLDTITTATHDIDPDGTVEFMAGSAQNIPVLGGSYGFLEITGAGTKTLLGDIDINGDLVITGTLDVNSSPSYDIYLAGDFTNTGLFNENDGALILDGSGEQRITASVLEVFNDVTLVKPTGDARLMQSIQIDGTLDLSIGDIIIDDHNLAISDGAVVDNASSTSYVQADSTGEMVKFMTSVGDTFLFPVGDITDYSPFLVELNAGTSFGGSDNMGVRVVDATHGSNSYAHKISRYWVLDATNFTAMDYSFRGYYVDGDIIGTEANLVSSIYDGTNWINHDTAIAAGNFIFNSIGEGTIPSNDVITGGGGAALPIELLELSAEVINGKVVVAWTTAMEINNDYFTVERSATGESFADLAQVSGKGTFYGTSTYSVTDAHPYSKTSYYRLKQTDVNGTVAYSDPVAVFVNVSAGFTFRAYPNPMAAGEVLKFNMKGIDPGEEVLVTLYNSFGAVVFSKVVISGNGAVLTGNDVMQVLPSGIYYIMGSSNDMIYKEKLIIAGEKMQ
jgi:hypothetical protein